MAYKRLQQLLCRSDQKEVAVRAVRELERAYHGAEVLEPCLRFDEKRSSAPLPVEQLQLGV